MGVAGALRLATLHTIFSPSAPMELLCVTQLSNSWTHDIIWDNVDHALCLDLVSFLALMGGDIQRMPVVIMATTSVLLWLWDWQLRGVPVCP